MLLTEKEEKALIAITEEALENMGGEEPNDLHEDNFSWFNRSVISTRTCFSNHVAAGLMSSLEEKGLIFHSEPDHEFGWCLEEEGIDKAQELFVVE